MQDLQTESGEPTDKPEKKSVKLPKFGENLSGDEEDDYSDGEGIKICKKLRFFFNFKSFSITTTIFLTEGKIQFFKVVLCQTE